jgi:myo-inositol catabolism protein IolC
MAVGYDRRLYILAFDHRGSFEKQLFGIDGTPTAEQAAQIRAAKSLIYDGFHRALASGLPRDVAGVLVDEEFGADVARRARADGAVLAMPVEKSGQDEFDLEYGNVFGDHIFAFDPAFTKVLVRYNPDGDLEMNRRQTGRLFKLSDWLHARGRKLLFELLVPATKEQLARVGGDTHRYDLELRADLMVRAIAELQAGGVEVDVWKIEGLDAREDCERVAAQTRSDGRSGVACVVLGRGADAEQVDHWLQVAASVPGYRGFAIGRSIFFPPLKSYLSGQCDRASVASTIAENYLRFIRVYNAAAPTQPGLPTVPSAPAPNTTAV